MGLAGPLWSSLAALGSPSILLPIPTLPEMLTPSLEDGLQEQTSTEPRAPDWGWYLSPPPPASTFTALKCHEA